MKLQGSVEACDGVIQLAFFLQGSAQVEVCVGIVRLGLDCLAVEADRFFQLSLILECVAQVVARIGIVRFQPQRSPEAGDRFVEFTLIRERVAEIIVRLRIIRLQLQSSPVAGDRFGQFARSAICFSQVVMKGSGVSLQPDRLLDVFDRHLMLTRLMRHHTQKVNRVGLLRIDGKNLPVDLLGRLPAACLVVPDGSANASETVVIAFSGAKRLANNSTVEHWFRGIPSLPGLLVVSLKRKVYGTQLPSK